MINMWIQSNKRRLEKIKRELVEYSYAGSYGGSINLMEVNAMLDGMLVEITKLTEENEKLKQEIKNLNTPVEPPKDKGNEG